MNQLRQKLLTTISVTAAYYGRPVSDEVLRMYSEDLADLDPLACIQAYADWRKNPRNRTMPLPGQIRGIVTPQADPESQAVEVTSRITRAIAEYGWCNSAGARTYIGEVGWAAVQRFGGWNHICENHGLTLQPGHFNAQCRQIVETIVKHPAMALSDSGMNLPDTGSNGELTSASDLLKKITTQKSPVD